MPTVTHTCSISCSQFLFLATIICLQHITIELHQKTKMISLLFTLLNINSSLGQQPQTLRGGLRSIPPDFLKNRQMVRFLIQHLPVSSILIHINNFLETFNFHLNSKPKLQKLVNSKYHQTQVVSIQPVLARVM